MTEQSISEIRAQLRDGKPIRLLTCRWVVLWIAELVVLILLLALLFLKRHSLTSGANLWIILGPIILISELWQSRITVRFVGNHLVLRNLFGITRIRVPFNGIVALVWKQYRRGSDLHIWYYDPQLPNYAQTLDLAGIGRWQPGLTQALVAEIEKSASLLPLNAAAAVPHAGAVWARPHFPNSLFRHTTTRSTMVFILGICVCAMSSIILLQVLRDVTISTLTSIQVWPFLAVMLILPLGGMAVGLWLILAWLCARLSYADGDATSVTWTEDTLTLQSRRAGEMTIPWSDIQSITLPPDPTSGSAEIRVAGRDTPVQIPLSHDIRSLLFVAALKERTQQEH